MLKQGKISMTNKKEGTQIEGRLLIKGFHEGQNVLYIPSHANGDPEHVDSEAGYITSWEENSNSVFVRYLDNKHQHGISTYTRNLVWMTL